MSGEGRPRPGRSALLRSALASATLLAASLTALLTSAAGAAQPIEIRDDRGASLKLSAPARRIVALSPHLAEIVFAAGAGRYLVGTSSASDYPEAARHVPVVSGPGRIDFERLLAVRPDLVLAWQSGSPSPGIERLEQRGIAVAVSEVKRIDDIPRLVRLVGEAAGTQSSALPEAAALDARIGELSPVRAAARALPVFVEIWHAPLITVGGAHLISDALRHCGASNVFEGARALSFQVSLEQLYRAGPQVMIINASPGHEAEARAGWSGAPVPAVRSGNLVTLDPEAFHRQGPRFVDVARHLCAELAAARARLVAGAP